MFPVFLDLTGRTVLVVGGGPVGRRKADALLAAGATVRLVDPKPGELAGAEWLAEPYQPNHLEGVALAIAAATPAVDAAVVADARKRTIWACSAGDPTAGDFVVPAVVRRGAFALAISTGGASPALARRVRERLEIDFDADFGVWVAVLAEFRAWAMANVPDAGRRRELLEGAADWSWLDRLRTEGPDAVAAALRERGPTCEA